MATGRDDPRTLRRVPTGLQNLLTALLSGSMGYAIGIIVVGLLFTAALSLFAHRGETRTVGEEPRLPHMVDVSKSLTGGLALVSTVLAFMASRSGGIGRVLGNEPDKFFVAIALAVLSVVVALGSLTIVAASPKAGLTGTWLVAIVVSICLFVASVITLTDAARSASRHYETAAISATLTKDTVTFDISLPLLAADETLTVTVYAYPAGVESIPVSPGQSGESRGAILFQSTTGPSADGTATIKGSVPRPGDEYAQVEVRAYRNGEDRGCLFAKEGEGGRTGCVQLWLAPPSPAVGA